MKPKFITFEGPEGSGKTSVIKAVYEALKLRGIDVFTTREPGGSIIAEQIRNVILDVDNKAMDPTAEALLYAASRRQHIAEKIIPALTKGQTVICDRFVDSSLAYQGHGRDLGIDKVFAINQYAIDNYLPDLTIFIDVPPHIGLNRVFANNRKVDRLDLESIEFHERVYEGYQILIKRYNDRIKVVDGTKPLEAVIEDTLKLIDTIL